jgi:chitin-binding protein
LAAVLVLVSSVGVSTAFVNTGVAVAHGSMTYPPSRTYSCYEDGRLHGNGDLNPTNPACVAAVAIGGKQPLWDWFGNLLSNAAGRHREIIPDGHLCGPQTKYDAYNLPRGDWPSTTLRAGSSITMHYNAWAPHPGTWEQYVTKDGFDVNQPLKWSDLEAAPFDKITNPPLASGEYSWNAQLPANKSGRHVIYSVWQRSDSPEAFYSCSDVVFTGGGGTPDTQAPTAPGTPTASAVTGNSVQLAWPAATDNIGVSGYRVYREAGATDVLVASPAGASTAVTGLTANTAYTFYVVAVDAAGNSSTASTPVTVTTGTSPAPGACKVTYTKPSVWSGGFNANIVIANTGTSAITPWSLVWAFPANQKLNSAWSADVVVANGQATAKGVSWNSTIAAGSSVDFGYNAAVSGSVTDPTSFTLNGLSCATS